VLGDLLCRARVLDLAQSRGEDQVEMPPHHVREGRLLAVTGKTLQQFKILSPLVHSLTLGCGPSLKPENFFQKSSASKSGAKLWVSHHGTQRRQRIPDLL